MQQVGEVSEADEEVTGGVSVGGGGRGFKGIRQHTPSYAIIRQHTSAYVSIRQHTSAYAIIRQHTSAYVSVRQHTSACGSIPAGGVVSEAEEVA